MLSGLSGHIGLKLCGSLLNPAVNAATSIAGGLLDVFDAARNRVAFYLPPSLSSLVSTSAFHRSFTTPPVSQADGIRQFLLERGGRSIESKSKLWGSGDSQDVALIVQPTPHMGGVDSYIKRYIWNLLQVSSRTVHVVSVANADYIKLNDEIIKTGKGYVHFHVIEADDPALDRSEPRFWENRERHYKDDLSRILDGHHSISVVQTLSTWLSESVWAFEVAGERGVSKIAIYPASSDPNQYRKDPKILGMADAIGTVYRDGVDDLEGYGFSGNVHYVGPMIDAEFYRGAFLTNKNAFRSVPGIYDLRKRYIFFAPHSIFAGKGTLETLMALKGLRDKGYPVSLVISSRIKTPEYYEGLKTYANKHGLTYREISYTEITNRFRISDQNTDAPDLDVIFIDSGLPHSVLPAFFQSVNLTVLATYEEAFGLSLAESWAMGVPAVATDVGGVPDGFAPSLRSRFLFAKGDTPEEHAHNLQIKLERALKLNLAAFGLRGQYFLLRNLHPGRLIQNHIDLLSAAISG